VNFVLDTNAVSETEKPRPNRGFMTWLYAQDPARLFITTISVAEVWNGFHRLAPNHQDFHRVRLIATNLPRKYRVLNFDLRAAATWGELTANASGPAPLRDSFIAAITRSERCASDVTFFPPHRGHVLPWQYRHQTASLACRLTPSRSTLPKCVEQSQMRSGTLAAPICNGLPRKA